MRHHMREQKHTTKNNLLRGGRVNRRSENLLASSIRNRDDILRNRHAISVPVRLLRIEHATNTNARDRVLNGERQRRGRNKSPNIGRGPDPSSGFHADLVLVLAPRTARQRNIDPIPERNGNIHGDLAPAPHLARRINQKDTTAHGKRAERRVVRIALHPVRRVGRGLVSHGGMIVVRGTLALPHRRRPLPQVIDLIVTLIISTFGACPFRHVCR